MKTVAVLASLIACASAQLVFDTTTGVYSCLGETAGKDFCAGDSLNSNIIIRCTGTIGQPGNCNDNLAGVEPVGVKVGALCYQSSDTAGDAACSFNNTVYPTDGSQPFAVPAPGSATTTSANNSTATPSGNATLPTISQLPTLPCAISAGNRLAGVGLAGGVVALIACML